MVTIRLLDLTLETINALKKDLSGLNYEIIVVDNGSTEKEKKILADNCHILIENGKNVGFVATNQGMDIASGNYFFISNNDLVACNNWYPKLLYHIEENGIDMVGPRSNAIYGSRQIYPLYYKDTEDFLKKTDEVYDRFKNQGVRVTHIGAGCMLMRRDVYDKIGGLVDFGLGGCEDLDYCIRAKMAGFKIGVALDTFFHHYFNSTYKKLKIDFSEENNKSQVKLLEIHGTEFLERIKAL